MFIYLFLASSHQLYAELWLDFLSLAGIAWRQDCFRGTAAHSGGGHPSEDPALLPWECTLLPLVWRLFTFLYLQHLLYFPLWVVRPVEVDILFDDTLSLLLLDPLMCYALSLPQCHPLIRCSGFTEHR